MPEEPTQPLDIIGTIESFGIDYDRFHSALGSSEPWGKLVHSFEYLTVLGVVESAWKQRRQ